MTEIRPAIWFSAEAHRRPPAVLDEVPQFDTRGWFMEREDVKQTWEWVKAHPDAIRVTDAYDALPPEMIAQLRAEAGR